MSEGGASVNVSVRLSEGWVSDVGETNGLSVWLSEWGASVYASVGLSEGWVSDVGEADGLSG